MKKNSIPYDNKVYQLSNHNPKQQRSVHFFPLTDSKTGLETPDMQTGNNAEVKINKNIKPIFLSIIIYPIINYAISQTKILSIIQHYSNPT